MKRGLDKEPLVDQILLILFMTQVNVFAKVLFYTHCLF
jgi:hypothetical protein